MLDKMKLYEKYYSLQCAHRRCTHIQWAYSLILLALFHHFEPSDPITYLQECIQRRQIWMRDGGDLEQITLLEEGIQAIKQMKENRHE